jgi:chemotaxis protein CheC
MFDDRQLDALKELFNIASGSAATVLSSFLKQDIRIEVPRIIEGKAATDLLRQPQDWAAIEHAVGGAIGGRLVVLVRGNELNVVLGTLLKREVTDWQNDEEACSAIREISNILTSYFLAVLGQFFRQVLVPGVPELTFEIETPLRGLFKNDQGMLVETRFYNPHGETLWYFVMMPEGGSMMNALNTLLKRN